MICNNCGKEVPYSKFCPDCGVTLSSDESAQAEKKKSFWDKLKEQTKDIAKREVEKQQTEKERIAKLDADGIAYCPRCHSTSLSANKKGFGIGKALIGGALTGGIGLIAGNIGAKKVRVTCLKCGYQFMAGK